MPMLFVSMILNLYCIYIAFLFCIYIEYLYRKFVLHLYCIFILHSYCIFIWMELFERSGSGLVIFSNTYNFLKFHKFTHQRAAGACDLNSSSLGVCSLFFQLFFQITSFYLDSIFILYLHYIYTAIILAYWHVHR